MDLLTQNKYDWPGQFTPFDHQKVTAEHLVRNKRDFCFNDIGTGKTLSLLWAADFLIQHKGVDKVLIAAPLSTLQTVWADEIFKNFVHRTYSVLYGSKAHRLKKLDLDVDFYIINHEGVDVVYEELKKRKDINLVIVDEGARIRNARTNKWKTFWKYAGPNTDKGLWWATGSPMPRGPEDVWAQAKMINPNNVHKYYTRFRDEMMRKVDMYRWVPVQGWEDKCYSFLQPSIRYTRDECLDLPDCTVQRRAVAMGKDQKKAYDQMKKDFVIELDEGTITAVNEGVKCIKLVQVAAGAVYGVDESVHYLNPTPKLEALKDAIGEAGDKALVFVPFRHSIPLLKKFMENMGLSVGVVYGDVPVRQRSKIFSDFQSGDLNIILAHPGTMAHGLTLTASHTIIWWAPVDNFETYEQANGRITRPGQKHKQTIVQLSCSEIETKIYTRLKNKERMQGVLLELLGEK